jgi:hypothetical protein
MCSMPDPRLGRIESAIDDLAAQAAGAGPSDEHDLAARLAEIWAMVADLDPALARRLAGYGTDG